MARGATLALVGAVGLVVGAAGGSWIAAPPRPARTSPVAPGVAAVPADLAPALADLARTLEALRTSLELARASPAAAANGPALAAPERVPLDAPAALRDDRELVAALNALATSLRGLNLGPAGAAGARAQSLVVPRWVDRGAAFASAGMRTAQDSDDELGWDRAMKAWRSKHLFWTAQQVLDAYGKPDEIESGNGQASWIYRLPVGDDGEETFAFQFDAGLVYAAEYDH